MSWGVPKSKWPGRQKPAPGLVPLNEYRAQKAHEGNGAAATRSRGSKVVYQCASEIALESIEWLWPGRLAKGKHTTIAGDPGVGKSQIAIYAVAQATTGGAWPCEEGQASIGNVIILSAEDGAGDTILPRLHAAGGDCGRVYIIKAVAREDGSGRRIFNLKVDLPRLEKMIAEVCDVILVVIDTVNSYLGNTDSHRGADVRAVLDPLNEMANRTGIAVLSINHFSKGPTTSQTKALHRFLGSIAFVGAPRIAFAALEDPRTMIGYCFFITSLHGHKV
jgi:RecA-family ATPase